MPELTPDPVFDKLARFSPTGVEPTDILFAAGRAAAPTRWWWKVAVIGLVVTNAAVLTAWLGRVPRTVVVTHTITVPGIDSPESPEEPVPPRQPGLYIRATDPDQLPPSEPIVGVVPTKPVLTAFAGHRGEID